MFIRISISVSLLFVASLVLGQEANPLDLPDPPQSNAAKRTLRALDRAITSAKADCLKALKAELKAVMEKSNLDEAKRIDVAIKKLQSELAGKTNRVGMAKVAHLARVKLDPQASIVPLAVGAVQWGNDTKYKWKSVSKSLAGKSFTQHQSKHQGSIKFEVLSDGVITMAMSGRPNASWNGESSEKALRQTGWVEVQDYGLVCSEGKKWSFWKKACNRGETYSFQNQKYAAPILID